MIHESGYDKIDLYPATKGMNQNIASNLLKPEYSSYIENIIPSSLGEGVLRNGTFEFSNQPPDDIIEGFSFSSKSGAKQQVLYLNGFQNFSTVSNLRIVSTNHIQLTSVNYALFKPDTFLQLRYTDKNGLSPVSTYEIKKIVSIGVNTIDIEVEQNSFADSLVDFYIVSPGTPNPVYISGTQFSITIPDGFITNLYYAVGGLLKLQINAGISNLTIAAIDETVPGQITFTTTGDVIPNFTGADTRILSYKSSTPQITTISNAYGYIKVLDVATNTILSGGNQTLSNLSVACVPRAEFFGKLLWIYNGVDPIMTWDGAKLEIYEEQVKDTAASFNRIDDNNFSFIPDATFDITKYQNGKSIRLIVKRLQVITGNLKTVVTAIAPLGPNAYKITTAGVLPDFTGQDILTLFYFDQPPPFSCMKGAHDRLWCLGAGAVSLEYRIPDLAMRYFYSYTAYTDETPFGFFNEKTKTVPSEDISAKHGIADNLEAIVDISGNLAFMGRQKTQIWRGIDPLTKGSAHYFSWSSTIPVGVYHGNLIVELPNDAYFLSPNGFVSFGTLNIARQFAASNTENMNNLGIEYKNSISTNIQYRSCRSFKYNNGGFCGFKVGGNNIIFSKFNTSLYWWGILSGDFRNASSFLSSSNESLYLYIDNKIYQYADGLGGTPILYGDGNGTRFIDFIETKYVNTIKNRYANKRYEIDADYSSSLIINKENNVNVYISGNLRDTFILEDQYHFPLKGDLLGTINLVDGSTSGNNPNNPDSTSLGMRLDAPSHILKGRLKFVSDRFWVTIAGKLKNGPFKVKRIRLFGISER